MVEKRHELIQNLERITSEIASLKKMIILEYKPSANGKKKMLKEDLRKTIKSLASKWDRITAVQEICSQREKFGNAEFDKKHCNG